MALKKTTLLSLILINQNRCHASLVMNNAKSHASLGMKIAKSHASLGMKIAKSRASLGMKVAKIHLQIQIAFQSSCSHFWQTNSTQSQTTPRLTFSPLLFLLNATSCTLSRSRTPLVEKLLPSQAPWGNSHSSTTIIWLCLETFQRPTPSRSKPPTEWPWSLVLSTWQ